MNSKRTSIVLALAAAARGSPDRQRWRGRMHVEGFAQTVTIYN